MTSPIPSQVQSRLTLQKGKLTIDLARHRVTCDNQTLSLSPTEFALLSYLTLAAPRVVPFAELIHQAELPIHGPPQESKRELRRHIFRLRRKLRAAQSEALIERVGEIGYVLAAPDPVDQQDDPITFLFSDVEGSTELWDQHSEEMRQALKRHDAVLRSVFEAHSGYVFKTVGDGFYVAFTQADQALAAALAAQRALQAEDWPTAVRLRVRMALSTGLAEARAGDFFGAPLNLAARLLSAGHGGQILLTQATREALVAHAALRVNFRDMGDRRFKGLQEPQRVFQVVASDLPARFPPLRTLDPRPTNLPAELTSFVGRERAVRAIDALLRRAEVRLVTLTGPGGIGKTRLGIQVAASLQDEYEDGVFFVSLAAVHNPDLIPSAIAQALEMPEAADRPLGEQLIAHLHTRKILLVLDNFEHLIEAAPLVNQLLRGASQLKVLVTSREALTIYGEHVFPVTPLTLPDAPEQITLRQLESFAGTALFLQRVRTAALDLHLTDEDAPIITGICASLDGLPLAIELAAARANQFSLSELAAALNSRLGFLNNGPRDLPARQRTLRGALDWSYDLLSGEEQALFARLAVFQGGWDVEAAWELVAGAGTSGQVEALLAALAAKSLIQTHPGVQTRYAMLESVREYALERLHSRGEYPAISQRHSSYYRAFVLDAEVRLTGDEQVTAFHALRTEADNLRAVLARSLAQPGDTTALKMCGVLWRWWAVHSYLSEGRSWLERSLAHSRCAPAALRAKALWGAGRLAYFQADYPAAEAMLRESLGLYRQMGDNEGMGWVLDAIGAVLLRRQEYAEATRLFEESLALHKLAGSPRGISHSLDDLGKTAFRQGDIDRAVAYFQEGLQLRRCAGSPEGLAVAIVNLSEALGVKKVYAEAVTLLREGLQLYRSLGQTAGVILCLSNLGEFQTQLGNIEDAAAVYGESLALLQEVASEEKELTAETLLGVADFLVQTGRPASAVRVLGKAKDRIGIVDASPALENQFVQQCQATKQVLDYSRWNRAWDEGKTMTFLELSALLSSPAEG